MNKGFDIAPDLRSELEKAGERFNPDTYAQKMRDLSDGAVQNRKKRRSLTRKFRDFFKALVHIPRLQRRLDQMQAERDIFRNAVIEDIRSELEKNTAVTIKGLDLQADSLLAGFTQQTASLDAGLEQQMALINQQSNLIAEQNDALRQEKLTRQKAFTALDRQVLQLRLGQPPAEKTTGKSEPVTPADPDGRDVETLLQAFYQMLEDRYRGSREEIKARLSIYRNDLKAARQRTGASGLVVDIGCGRGEFLEVMREEQLNATGIDLNDHQLDMARQHGLPVVHGDALSHLQGLAGCSVLAISAIHLIEHLPFSKLIKLAEEIERVLMPGGIVIFETPNPRNLIVGATTFNLDPTHIKPLPFEVTEILLETVGFPEVEFRPLHPWDSPRAMRERNIDIGIAQLLFGPQDYAAVAVKPQVQ